MFEQISFFATIFILWCKGNATLEKWFHSVWSQLLVHQLNLWKTSTFFMKSLQLCC